MDRNNWANRKDNASSPQMIGAEKSENIKIKDLYGVINCPTITCLVRSIHPNGLISCGSNRCYLPFTISDETGQIVCKAWHEIAKPLSKVIGIGRCMKIIGGKGDIKKGTSIYQITMGRDSKVEICNGKGDIYVCNGRDNLGEPLLKGKAKVDHNKSVPAPVQYLPEKVSSVPCHQKTPPHRCKINAGQNFAVVSKTKIAELKTDYIYPCIEIVVKKVIVQGTSSKGTSYLKFIGCDDTGNIGCTFWESHARTFGSVIKSGVYLQLKKVRVKPVMKEYISLIGNKFEIEVSRTSEVKVLPKLTEEQTASMGYVKKHLSRLIVSKAPKLPKIPPVKVSELISVCMCKCIELKVESMVTAGIVISPLGIRYVTFIGSDDTGRICCTIYEPLCIEYGKYIKIDTCLKMYNVSVKEIDARFLIPGVDNRFEIVTENETLLKILSIPRGEHAGIADPVAIRNVVLESFDQLAFEKDYFVDFNAVVNDLEMNTKDQYGIAIACQMTVVDESAIKVPVMIRDKNDIPPSLEIGAIVVCRNILVRRVNKDWELKFIPEKSVIIPITSNTIKEEELEKIKKMDSNITKRKDPNAIEKKDSSDWGTHADRFL